MKAGLWANGNAKAKMDEMGFSAQLQAAIAIGAQLNVEGDLTWTRENHELKLGGNAEVFVGGRANASIKSPIFGPTELAFNANLTVGFGTAISTKAAIAFSEAALAASQELRKMIYWRTLAQDWSMDLENQEAKNLYYLNKALARLEDELIATDQAIESYHKIPSEKQSLVMAI